MVVLQTVVVLVIMVMMMVVIMAMIVMIMIVVMIVIVLGEEIRFEFEDTVEIERAAFQNIRQRHLAALGVVQLGVRVDAAYSRFNLR
jgi:hypothetical protein